MRVQSGAVALALAVVAAASPAAAQSFFSCRSNGGEAWGLHRVQGQAIALWSPGDGWSGNLCASERSCMVMPDSISMSWETREERVNHLVIRAYEMTINRRSGTATRRSLLYRELYDGQPHPQFRNGPRITNLTGTCAPAEDPAAGPPLF